MLGSQRVSDPPLPPLEMRELVGRRDVESFDNPSRGLVFADVPEELYRSVLDFGCGCGRVARMLIQQKPQPENYVGIDLHKGMINWCRNNLTTVSDRFQFFHHDVFNPGFNPEAASRTRAIPVKDRSATLFLAWSVFTHMNQDAAEFYLREMRRTLADDGLAITTWFLFDKTEFPMMQDFQNALFINDVDPTNAVIFDRDWFLRQINEVGLVIVGVTPPEFRGFHWYINVARVESGRVAVTLPQDVAPTGRVPPPVTSKDPGKIA